MKKTVLILAAALSLIMPAGCTKGKSGAAQKGEDGVDTIRLGVMTDSILEYSALIGNAQGIFKQHGLAVEITSFAAGINTIDAVTLDQMDVGFGADFAVINRFGGSPSTPLRIFSGIGEGVLDAWKFYACGDGIKTPADLKGKAVVTHLGTVTEYWLAKTLEAYGLSVEDITLIPTESPLEGVAMIQSGAAQAQWANARAAQALLQIEGVHVISNLEPVGAPTISVLIAQERFLQTRADAAVKYLQALQEIFDFIDADIDRAAQIINKNSATPVEQARINLLSNISYINFNQDSFDALENLYQWTWQNGVIKYSYTLRDYIDTRSLKAAFPGRGDYR